MFFAASGTLTKFLGESWYLFAGLIAVVSLLVWLVMWLRTRLRDDTDRPTSPNEMLKQFQDSLREGELTDEEYRFIKGRLLSQDQGMSKLTEELGLQFPITSLNESTDSSKTTELSDDQTTQEKE